MKKRSYDPILMGEFRRKDKIDVHKVARDAGKVIGWLEVLAPEWWKLSEEDRHRVQTSLGRVHDAIEAFARQMSRESPEPKVITRKANIAKVLGDVFDG